MTSLRIRRHRPLGHKDDKGLPKYPREIEKDASSMVARVAHATNPGYQKK